MAAFCREPITHKDGLVRTRIMMSLCICMSVSWGACVRRESGSRLDGVRCGGAPAAQPVFPMSRPRAESYEANRPVALQTQFYVWTFELPTMDSEVRQRFWKHVHQDLLALEEVRALARNGLRVGIGNPSSWPALRAMLKKAGAETTLHIMSTEQNAPLTLELEAVAPGQPMFYYTRDDQLIGARDRGGTKAWRIEYDVDLDDIARMTCRVTPQVIRGIKPALVPQLEPLRDIESFEDMRFEAVVEGGEYVIIGPGSQSELTTLVGSQFVKRVGPEETGETIYCILPRIVRR